MATIATALSNPTLPGRRYDRVFFAILAALILGTVYIGFAPTYYRAGLITARFPAGSSTSTAHSSPPGSSCSSSRPPSSPSAASTSTKNSASSASD
jgi:hypothetical protein